MGEYVFEVIDKTRRKIHLSQERWRHILKHRQMSQKLEAIQKTLMNPTLIIPNAFDETKVNYYSHLKSKQRYLLVAVKYLNGKGFICTAFIARKIIKR